MFIPASMAPVTTRLENIRDGLEDWELFKMLDGAHSAPLLQTMVRSATDWSVDFQSLSEARLAALEMLN